MPYAASAGTSPVFCQVSGRETDLSYDCGLDLLCDVAHIVVGDPRTGRQTDAYLEKIFRHAVDVSRIGGVDGLAVHRFPEGTGLDVGLVEGHAECLDVGVGLAVGHGA